MNYLETTIAGFGGQGILSAGRILAYAGLIAKKSVSWYPSYGPEMRGGTANCGVVIANEEIGSPIISNPHAAIVMNIASLDKFESELRPNGLLIVDSSLVPVREVRKDIEAYFIPATEIADSLGNKTFANIVMLGKLIGKTGIVTPENFEAALKKSLPPKKHFMIPDEMKALEYGMNFQNEDKLANCY
jgi:2-oxoglutarate ferredoxin oxidoreductase subunit gamma